ncbi:ABC transporter permease subunit [Caldibacillus lycopersici]|uniref:ABC transporter permease subunit n=1 Tax=Perspicuibacillus lycopersici TaxID=1325689 RepID=A0AAE3LRQ7_9BACI|nr:ABC transporter permease subunit [Perspicuibacillus lycopersici]MCU9614934.1 ABC transporter permease subunit [Perspicuibacillus lycopersici]
MKLLVFELRKIIFDKKFLYLTIFLFAGIAILFLRNMLFDSYIEKEEQQKIDSYVLTNQSNKRLLERTLEVDPNNEELQQLKTINDQMLETLFELRSIRSLDDWQTRLMLENEFFQMAAEYKNAGGDHPLSFEEIEKTIALNQKLLQENIKPEHPTYTTALPNFLMIVTNLFINLGAISLLLLFVGDIVSSEFENRSIYFLYTQPLNKIAIFTSKWISSIFVYLFIIFILYGTAIILPLLFGDKGTFQYPILLEKNQEIRFITMKDYLIQSFIIVSIIILVVVNVCMFYSLYFKNTLGSLFALSGTLFAGYAVTFIPWKFLFWLNPFQYLLGESRILDQNNSLWYQGIAAGVVLSLLMYLLSLQKIKFSKLG